MWSNRTRDQRQCNRCLCSNLAHTCSDSLWLIQSLTPFLNSRYINQWIWIHQLGIRVLMWRKVTSVFSVVSLRRDFLSHAHCSPANVTSQATFALWDFLPHTRTPTHIRLHPVTCLACLCFDVASCWRKLLFVKVGGLFCGENYFAQSHIVITAGWDGQSSDSRLLSYVINDIFIIVTIWQIFRLWD